MPIYEFECPSCGDHFDRLQKLSDPDPDVCPQCGATGVRRCLTAPSFRLSGSGWYETDFKKDGDKKRNLVDKPEPVKSDAPPSASSDAKPAKTSESSGGDAKPKATPAEKPAAQSKPKPADA